MMTTQFLRSFFEQAVTSGSRSTVLKPLGWIVSILMSGGLVSYYIHAPDWIGTSLIIFSLISALFYLYSYFYFMSRDKDSLRSEKYSIQKLAIEKGLVGDNIQGLFDLNPQINLRVLSSSTTDEKENR